MKLFFTILVHVLALQTVFAGENTKVGSAVVNNCSAGFIKLMSMPDTQKAIVITNGHCLLLNLNYGRELAYPYPGEYLQNMRDVNFLDKTIVRIHSDNATIELKPHQLIFGTMSGTDLAIFELNETYLTLKNQFGIDPLIVDSNLSSTSSSVQIQSGYFNRTFDCSIQDYVDLIEGPFQTQKAIRLTKECDIYPGVSGSPIVSRMNGRVIGLANTHSSGEGVLCGFNNPCIVLPNKNIQYIQPKAGTSFGISLVPLNDCFDIQTHQFDFSKKQCGLMKMSHIDIDLAATSFSEDEMNYRLNRFKEFAAKQLKHRNIQIKIEKDDDWDMHLGSSGLDKNIFTIAVGAKVYQTPNLSADSFDLILCHELGHLLGASPKKKNELNSSGDWASGEGESDYFAGSCVTQLWNQDFPVQFDKFDWDVGVNSCKSFPHSFQISLCQRAEKAALSFFNILYSQYGRFSPAEKSAPSLSKKDQSVVSATELNYPQTTQCRLDSSRAGIYRNPRPSCWYKEKN